VRDDESSLLLIVQSFLFVSTHTHTQPLRHSHSLLNRAQVARLHLKGWVSA